jgi:hypothetical protein
LKEEGYDIEIRSGHLLLKSVPYVNAKREVVLGMLVSLLTLAGDETAQPADHVAMFAGEYPCRADGSPIEPIRNSSERRELDRGLIVDHSFSSKPTAGPDKNYYDKMTRYVTIISGQAEAIDPTATAKSNRFVEATDENSAFAYVDTASSNAGITAVSRSLELGKVGIVGLGGTGSYILDLVAKTPVKQIHLFDGDSFLQHNAFRAPGAPSIEDLRARPLKVDYLAQQYSKMHRGIVPHDYYLDRSNVEELRGMDFVFLALDRGYAKRDIVEKLLEWQVAFVDVGMGVDLTDGSLAGILRITSATAKKSDHVLNRIPFSEADPNADYSRNIQIADLNALNAALAILQWKKHCGFYRDLERPHFITYTISTNVLTNEENA